MESETMGGIAVFMVFVGFLFWAIVLVACYSMLNRLTKAVEKISNTLEAK